MIIDEMSDSRGNFLKQEVQRILEDAYRAWAKEQSGLDPEAPVLVETPPANVPGDLATNFPMSVAKKLRRAPREVAQGILTKLSTDGAVARGEIAGPGFLNVFLKDLWLIDELRTILKKRAHYAERAPGQRDKVLLEFVSANPTGPLHVGHGRGAALGDCLARILRHLGHAVTTEYYVNNVGNQMENLGASVIQRCLEIKPDAIDESERAALAGRKPEDLYKGGYIVDIAHAVIAAHPTPASRARGLSFFRGAAVAHILQGIREDLAAFNVGFDTWFEESSLFKAGQVDKSLAALKAKGHLKEEAGALWFLSTKFGDDKDRVIKRQDERLTYFASDIAYHDAKFARGFDRLIDIWGTDHHGYVPRVRAAVEALGQDPDRLTLLLYQLVSLVRAGKPVAMSTRSGEFVTLKEVVDEVGKDAARFFFALRSPNSQLEFDLELAKKQAPENPVFYIQYVHARCCSLFREAEKRGMAAGEATAFPAPGALAAEERTLLVKLASYPDAVELCAQDLSPHHLTNYLLSLAGDYHRFYEKRQVLTDDAAVRHFRMALADGVRTVIQNGLGLLGVSAPETM